MNNKGNYLGLVALELVVTVFVIIVFYSALDQPIQEGIIDNPGITLSAEYNETMNNQKTIWYSIPYIIVGGSILLLVVVAISKGGG